MQTDIIFILAIMIALAAAVISLKHAIAASETRQRYVEFCKFIVCVIVFLICAWGFVFSNSLLWYGQNPANAEIALDIQDETVEEQSFLYLLQELNPSTTADDVIAIMGSNYEENTASGYMIRYVAPDYTLNGEMPAFISFIFTRDRTRILQVTWSYKDPADSLFSRMLEYLEANAFGTAASSTETTADWVGLHLGITDTYLLLQRIF